MRFAAYTTPTGDGVAVMVETGAWRALGPRDAAFPGTLSDLIAAGPSALARAFPIIAGGHSCDIEAKVLPPLLPSPGKILCVGLNYADHAAEGGFKRPDHPTIFTRFASTLIGHNGAIVRPSVSHRLDYEGELAVIIGRRGRAIPAHCALEYVAGYSVFNDATIRDYQSRTTQWTLGKNFDATGPFGPMMVTPDELPPGARGLRITTRLNGQTVQDANTDAMIFDVPTLIASISEVMTLEPGDVIVTGTPAGVGFARTPRLWMKAGDVVEVEIERIGTIRSKVLAELPA